MNGPIDDKAFEEYLQRGSAVSEQYRALDSEDVPADIDAAVLARASEAVREPVAAKRSRLRRWSVPVALAASTVLAVSIVLESGTRHEVALTSAPQSTASEQVVPQPTQAEEVRVQREQALRAQDERAARAAQDASAARAKSAQQAMRARAAREVAPPPAPPAAAPEPDSASAPIAEATVAHDSGAGRRADQQSAEQKKSEESPVMTESYAITQATSARPAMAPPRAASPAPQQAVPAEQEYAREMEGVRDDPERWLEHIRNLREENELDRADQEWREFRAAFPDYPVADDDRAQPAR